MTQVPSFPPLFKGLAAGPANPFSIACAQARRGVDAGLLTWSLGEDRLRAALVLAPEVPIDSAMAAFVACAVGMQNALGVMAPPEIAVHLEWAGGLRVNGGHCGGLHVAAAATEAGEVPDWLVIGLEITLDLPPEYEPGETPDWTALRAEGCGEVNPIELLEAWARHSLIWINELESTSGRARLHREWEGLAWKKGETVVLPEGGQHVSGTFLGVDENFGMLLKTPDGATRLIPLSTLIEKV